MPEYDGKVHISTGVYWGFLVAYLGYYSTFLSFTVWVLIQTYYTQPTYQTIINAIASTFYDRIIGPSLEKIVDELASSGVTDFVTGAVLFVITALKSILRPSRVAVAGAARVLKGRPSGVERGSIPSSHNGSRTGASASSEERATREVAGGLEGLGGRRPSKTQEEGAEEIIEGPGSAGDSTGQGTLTPRDAPINGVVPNLKEIEVSTSPQIYQLGNPIGVPVLRPPVPPKIRISSLR